MKRGPKPLLPAQKVARGTLQPGRNLQRNRGANVLDYVVTRDEQMWHMVGDCRLALNALAHHFGIERKVLARAEAA